MAQRRMFSKTITNSSVFLMMPASAQFLYFHLGMNTDDDGFCEYFGIMRMIGSTPDDLKVLQAKQFVHIFDDKVLIILDWRENNFIRSDRYKRSRYLDIYRTELAELSEKSHMLPLGIPNGNQMDTNGIPLVDQGKGRVGKVTDINSENFKKNVDELWTEMISPHLGRFAPSTIVSFENHWRQKKDDGMELWQTKEVFDIDRRLDEFQRNRDQWEFDKNNRR